MDSVTNLILSIKKKSCKFLKFNLTYKELSHPTHTAKLHRQHSHRMYIKYSKKDGDRKIVSTRFDIQEKSQIL